MSLSLVLALGAAQAGLAADAKPDVTVPSRPDTTVRGYFSPDLPPVAHVKPGQTVRIDALSQGGITKDPVGFFGEQGVPADQVLKDVVDQAKMDRGFGHVITGPVYIEGAEPGDMLEVRILKIDVRVPYGTNTQGPRGVVDDVVSGPNFQKVIKFDMKRRVALMSPDIEIPLAPFMGIMAVAPPPSIGKAGSREPQAYGGNMDLKTLTAGSTLYLPVFVPGALFFTGDSHAVQGDGEVDGTAIEASMTPTVQFILHKGDGKTMVFPRAEDANYYYIMGMDHDLDTALKNAVHETVKFLGTRGKLTPADSYTLASIGVDFSIAEAVDGNLVVYGKVPKSIFKTQEPYWNKGG